MTDTATLAATMTALADAIIAMPQATVNPKVYDPFKSNDPFVLSSRSGSMAYERIFTPFDDIWDGEVAKFPSFVTELRIRAAEGKWNLDAEPDILKFGTQNILTDYQSISDADIEAARVARTSDCALQNALSIFTCIKSSIKGTLKDTIFNRIGNIPTHNDGVALFKQITSFSTVASVQLSMLSFQHILNFDITEHNFDIPTINSKPCNLFTLATSSTRTLAESERIQHALSAYSKILQPDTWARWVGTKVYLFEEGKLTQCQDFMNLATMKFNKIVNASGISTVPPKQFRRTSSPCWLIVLPQKGNNHHPLMPMTLLLPNFAVTLLHSLSITKPRTRSNIRLVIKRNMLVPLFTFVIAHSTKIN